MRGSAAISPCAPVLPDHVQPPVPPREVADILRITSRPTSINVCAPPTPQPQRQQSQIQPSLDADSAHNVLAPPASCRNELASPWPPPAPRQVARSPYGHLSPNRQGNRKRDQVCCGFGYALVTRFWNVLKGWTIRRVSVYIWFCIDICLNDMYAVVVFLWSWWLQNFRGSMRVSIKSTWRMECTFGYLSAGEGCPSGSQRSAFVQD